MFMRSPRTLSAPWSNERCYIVPIYLVAGCIQGPPQVAYRGGWRGRVGGTWLSAGSRDGRAQLSLGVPCECRRLKFYTSGACSFLTASWLLCRPLLTAEALPRPPCSHYAAAQNPKLINRIFVGTRSINAEGKYGYPSLFRRRSRLCAADALVEREIEGYRYYDW